MSKDCTFELLISSFGSTMQLPPKSMVVAYAVAAPKNIVEIHFEQVSHTAQEASILACTTSTIADIHYKLTETRKCK